MEIRVKTATEFHDSHVTIEIRAADVSEAALVAEVGDAQASEAELVAAPLQRRITALEEETSLGRRQILTLGDELISEREHNNRLKLGNDELARTVTRLREELDRVNKGHVCVETCRPNAHVAFKGRRELDALERELADARRAIDILSGQLGRVSGAVHRPDLQDAMRTTWSEPNARAMKDAIRAVRDALGSPSPPDRAMSQA